MNYTGKEKAKKEGISYQPEGKADFWNHVHVQRQSSQRWSPQSACMVSNFYPSVKARRRRSQIILHKTATTHDDTVWQLTRKALQRKLPVGRLCAAKYLRVVECKSTHRVKVGSLLWVYSNIPFKRLSFKLQVCATP
jgi:hypothetical protein